MTRDQALTAMKKKTPVIYTGAGSMGRAQNTFNMRTKKRAHLRGSKESMGVIIEVKVSKAIVSPQVGGYHGMIFHIKDLKIANKEELSCARADNKKYLSGLHFTY